MRFINFEQYDNLKSAYYLNKAINECRLLVESYPNVNSLLLEAEEEAPYEWDFVNNKFYDRISGIETDIKKSASYVRTAEQGISFIKNLTKQIVELPDKVKSDFVKIAIAALAINLSYNQLTDVDTEVNSAKQTDTVAMINNELDKQIVKKQPEKEIKKVMTKLTFSDSLVDFLKNEEGIGGEPVLTAYDLGDGAYTIGYGHAVFRDPSRGDNGGKYDFLPKYNKITPGKTKITPEQAEILLRDDIKTAADGLDRLLDEWKAKGINPKITQPMYDAMVSMIYNMGIDNFRQSDFIQLVKKNKFQSASEVIKNTSNQMFKKYPGLITRRSKESELFKSGLA
jgi:GH24 family phage-related lysozyme (muramidase)